MNIVYGVSGDGMGHVFEALEIADVLKGDGHAVKVLTYGERALSALRAHDPVRIEGFPLAFNSRGLSAVGTIARNTPTLRFYFRNWKRLRRELGAFRPDVFLTAYEPFTTLMAHSLRRPLVSMDNQNALLYLRERPPRGHRMALALVKLTTRVVTWKADIYLVKSFLPANSPRPNVRFVAPIVQRAIRPLRPSAGNQVLVYLTRPNPGLLRILATLPEQFLVYGGDGIGRDGNLTFRPRGSGFPADLASCKAIIGTTGFSLIADAIYLKKPYFGVPLKRQFEQTVNAFFLASSGLGEFSEDPSRQRIEAFLGRLPAYRERLQRLRFDPAEQERALREVLGSIERSA